MMKRPALPAFVAAATFSLLVAACATSTPESNSNSAAPGAVFSLPSAPEKSFALRPRHPQGVASAAQGASAGLPAQRSVYYEFDQYDVKPQFRPAIEANARFLQQHAGAHVTVQGNGDERGSREYNLALGQRRAESVRQMMRLSGASDRQIETVSFGEEKPKAPGHDEASWAENRRSDLVYDRAD